MRIKLFFLALVGFVGCVSSPLKREPQAGSARCMPFPEYGPTVQDLMALISRPECGVRTISDLLAQLPSSMLNQYALFYRSRSIQGPQVVDYLNPRVLLESPTLRVTGRKTANGTFEVLKVPKYMVISFNNSPTHSGSTDLEVLEVDEQAADFQKIFQYYEIKFPWHETEIANHSWNEVQSQIFVSAANPGRCTRCHDSPARPIFPGYPDWEGAFGSLHVSEGTPEERQGLESYLRHLDGPEVTRYQKLVPLGSQTESAMALFDGANDSLNINLANSNAIRVANLCQRSEGYGRYRYALAGALLNCREYPKFFPPGLYTELMANLNTRFDLENVWTDTMIQKFVQVIQTNPRHFQLSSKATFETLLYSAGGDQAFLRLLLDTYRDQGISRADPMGARLRLVMEGRGLKIDNWFLDLTQPTYRFLPADGQEVIYHLLKLDRGFDSDLKAKLAKLNPESRTSICQDMRDLSLLALKSIHAKPVAPEPKIDLAAYPVTFVKTCAKCHDSGEDYPPTIPFRSSLQMTEWLKRGSNLLLLRKKILTNDETERMPPTRILTADELNNIENWLAVF